MISTRYRRLFVIRNETDIDITDEIELLDDRSSIDLQVDTDHAVWSDFSDVDRTVLSRS
jgi:hypothetical protein